MTADAELLTVPEVMALLKISRPTVYGLVHTRRLASITFGRARRIPAHALTALLDTTGRTNPGDDGLDGPAVSLSKP
ncbi:helix-turn-helix domain-containing protein [Streptomyces sp. NPDC090108]|uniref:helix-turn-helix domain-containing protein n=1 Tax=Streptomyces sp. NPDC090108 TaxID=3365947 RepID=UPI0038291DE1